VKLKKLLEDIDAACNTCNECDPCCTWNVLKKCIENKRVILHNDRSHQPVLMSLVEA
jgi:hypothetical protein